MTIRQATEHDEAELKRLFLEYCAAMNETGDPERFWRLRPQEPNGTVLVMDEEGTLLGFLGLLRTDIAVEPFTLGVVQMFYVSSAWSALSWRLMRAGVTYYRVHGILRLAMFCSNSLVRFWKKHKFEPTLTLMVRTL